MNIRRALFENANHLLAKGGLCLTRTNADYVSSIPGEELKSLIDASLATVWGDWYDAMAANQAVGYCPSFGRNVFTQRIIEFIAAYRSFNGKNIRSGGLFLNNTLSLFAVATFLEPDAAIDSGTFTGNSAWTLAEACPQARVDSFDLTHVALRRRDPRVNYHLSDWSAAAPPIRAGRTLAFFDDHVDQVQRVAEAVERNVKYLVFDDDTPVNATHTGHNPGSFPKLSFLYSAVSEKAEVLRWHWLGRPCEVHVDFEKMCTARDVIAHYSRLPDVYPVTGFTPQWPLSFVVLK